MHGLPTTELATEQFLTAFESGTLAGFPHTAHIFTGACYIHSLGEPATITHMRDRIRAFNLAKGGQNTGTSGYHETITLFWVKLLAAHLVRHPGLSRVAFAHHAVDRYAADRDLLLRYYSYNVTASPAARQTWHPPDLLPL